MRLVCVLLLALCLRCKFAAGALFFPTNSAYGILGALAVPLDLPHRSVFISYNFEANYNLPATWGIPPAFLNVEDEDVWEYRKMDSSQNGQCSNCTESDHDDGVEEKQQKNATEIGLERARRSLLSRTHFYHILKDKFEKSGFAGENCLLRLICETNASELGQVNGVLGTIIHILFTPTTSWYEHLPMRYYQAEIDGQHDECHHYEDECKDSLLDLISMPLHEIMNAI